MSEITVSNTSLNNNLSTLLTDKEIQPGDQAGYELCKQIWQYHPLGGKLVEKPVKLALSKPRSLSIDSQPKEMLLEAFQKEWDKLGATNHIRDVMYLNRTYGAAAIVMGSPDMPTTEPLDPWKLPELEIYFNQLDPLNLAGSIVTNQNPNAPDFQKPLAYTTAAGQPYHPSRSVVVFNGTPIYLSFQSSAFGFTGRSVFQRALYPLRSFIQSMVTDDLVTFKSGLIIAKMKPAGSIVNRLMQQAAGIKREYLQSGTTGNILSIDIDEMIEAIDLGNTATAMTTARDNIIANIAAAADVPALLLKDEAFTQGFGEGTEDAKAIVQYVNGIRDDMESLFAFFDKIVMHRAWNQEFYAAVQKAHPDIYRKMSYEQAFYSWQNHFKAEWESLIEEPESEKVKVEETKLKGLTEIMRTVLPIADPENRARMVQWAMDNLNEMPTMFQSTLQLDMEALAEYEPPEQALPADRMPKADALYSYIDEFYGENRAKPIPKVDAFFLESDHPRDGDGKFTSGSGGNGGSAGTSITGMAQPTIVKSVPMPQAPAAPTAKQAEKPKQPAAPSSKPKEAAHGKGEYKDKRGYTRSGGLAVAERKVESSFYSAITHNKKKLIANYYKISSKEAFPNTIDADKVKLLSPAFVKDRGLAPAVHEPSSMLSKVIYTDALKQKAAKGDESPTIFTAGGSGSGKSATTGLAAGLLGVGNDALVYDSVMSNSKKAADKIDECLKLTKGKAAVVYTNTPVQRAVVFNALRDRSVSIDILLEAHIGASNSIRELQEKYKGNERVNIQIINNSGPPKNIHVGKVDDVPKYNKETVRAELVDIVTKMHEKGEITKRKYDILVGNKV